MGTLPTRSVSSIASYFQGLKIKDKTEKALMVRIGVLVDSVVNAQRGLSNAGAKLDRRSQAINSKRPPKIFGSTENVFNGAAITIDPIKNSSTLSNYEVQIDSDPNFSDPTTKVAFNKTIIFKGLDAGVSYNIRVRALTKNGQVGPWSVLEPVVTTVSNGITTADFDGTLANEGRESNVFTFAFFSEQIFSACNFGLMNLTQGGGDNGEGGPVNWGGLGGDFLPDWPATLSIDASTETIETHALFGPLLTTDTSNVTYDISYGQLIRYWPIMLFDLFNPSSDPDLFSLGYSPNPIHPHTRTFFVTTDRISSTGNSVVSFTPTQEPVVWIKF